MARKTTRKLAALTAENVQELIGVFWSAFTWEDSPQGDKYWRKVANELEKVKMFYALMSLPRMKKKKKGKKK